MATEKVEALEAQSPKEHQIKWEEQTDGTKVIALDSYLAPHAGHLRWRYQRFQDRKREIIQKEGSMDKFSKGYEFYGFNKTKDGIQYREWLPGARAVNLIGDFNGWNRESHPCKKNEFGVWEIFLPNKPDGSSAIPHATKVKISVVIGSGERVDRLPAWSKVCWQEGRNPYLDSVYWDPPTPYKWKNPIPPTPKDLRIYESHVGMSSEEPKVSTYWEFAHKVLPMIKDLGYNAIQLMGIMEHAYYASFGYQVTNFFAISSRFGTPEELKELIDIAHGMGLVVFLDLIHSHASKNVNDGLNQLDGTDHLYFHEGGRGHHPMWDSRLFNYGNWEVLRFLMSNARWYIDEYHFDGFRFDGVTSMIYQHHGMFYTFTRGYDEYFDPNLVDEDALLYLTLCNDMLHSLRDDDHRVVTVAEEVSGMTCLCRPVSEGGYGFDYRLGMGIPDKWIELLRGVKDEDWSMGNIVFTLTNRRWMEATIAYAESHDQSLVGDKTIAFWLMDKEMYTNMSVLQPENPIVSRGMALHKLIRLITCALGGEGYLTFMGNEFGHPEWVDFPREGNNDSYHYARRRWDLIRDPLLRYKFLWEFDKAMMHVEDKYKWLPSPQAYVSLKHEGDKIVAFERGGIFWVFNFHHEKSYTDYRLGISRAGKYKIVLNSDAPQFGGYNRITKDTGYFTQPTPWNDLPNSIQLYLPCRSAQLYALEE